MLKIYYLNILHSFFFYHIYIQHENDQNQVLSVML